MRLLVTKDRCFYLLMNKDLIITLLLLLLLSLSLSLIQFTERCICVSLIEKALNGFFQTVSFFSIIHSFACETKFVQLNILFVMIINLTR